MQSALARRLAAAADGQPAVSGLSRRTEIYFEDNVACEIPEQDVPVINIWLTCEISGEDSPKYAIGAVMALKVAATKSGSGISGRESSLGRWRCRGYG